MGRLLRVDHVRYKRREEEGLEDNVATIDDEEGKRTRNDGDERRKKSEKKQRSESDSDNGERKGRLPFLKERKLALLEEHDDEDPMKEFLIQEKKEEVARALENVRKHKTRDGRSERPERHHRHRHHHHRRRSHSRDRPSSHRARSRSRSAERRHRRNTRDRT